MDQTSIALTDDLSTPSVVISLILVGASIVFLLLELRHRERYGWLIAFTGIAGALLLLLAVMRPVRVKADASMVGPRVVVLVDDSRRLLLEADGEKRRERAIEATRQISEHFESARLSFKGFGDEGLRPFRPELQAGDKLATDSDLASAMAELARSEEERPEAVIVVSDGRLTRPGAAASEESLARSVGVLEVPVHTVSVADEAPPDAAIRSIAAAGAAVAHQPLSLTIQLACTGGLECDEIPVAVRELRRGVEPAVLAKGVANIEDGEATIDLTIVLERAAQRVVEVSIEAPEGDKVPENDTRIVTFSVTRDRIRLLHIAGRPTYDVRALRRWLKSDESIDLIAFFILRTAADEILSRQSELALIPFPVDELFTEHLPSFDAIVLQDIDAVAYGLAKHLPAVEEYVRSGGGVIMVGGPTSFLGGEYGGTALERILPVSLPSSSKPFDVAPVVPQYTDAGRAAPVLDPLRDLLGEQLPRMPGANILGPAQKGSIVLWEHPRLKAGKDPMPLLALGESGDGRTIALGLDGSHQLAFSELAAEVMGRSYGALWEGLLGWLMRDPRYEAARVELAEPCIAGEPIQLRATVPLGIEGELGVVLERLGPDVKPLVEKTVKRPSSGPVDIELKPVKPGGYSAEVTIGDAPPTRLDFGCELGGAAWSDTRPDPQRLERIAAATGGQAVERGAVNELELPESTRVAAERHVSPLVPPWVWTLAAAGVLGAHWLLRRRGGLA